MARQISSHGRMDAFVKDVGASLKEAGHDLHDAFEKLCDKPVAKQSPVLSPIPASPISQAPTQDALPLPVFEGSTTTHATFAHLPASVPAVKDGLLTIKNELIKLIASDGGYGVLAGQAVEIIEGAIANPAAEGAVVLSDVAKIVALMIRDFTTAGAAAAPATGATPNA